MIKDACAYERGSTRVSHFFDSVDSLIAHISQYQEEAFWWWSHFLCNLAFVKCGKNVRGNSGNSRCQVWIYKMSEGTSASAYVLCTFRLLSQDFGMRRMEYWRSEYQREGWSCSQSRTQRTRIERRTYLIFKLKYPHDKSKVFILRQQNKQEDKSENNFSCLWNLSECFLDVAHVQKGNTRTLEAGSCGHFISNDLKARITLYLSCKCLAKSI